jgi:glycosyltransferase involved in cell wall biosynthesis
MMFIASHRATSDGLYRILYVEGNPDGTVGGSFFSLLYLVEGLERSRYEPVVVFAKENPVMERFRAAGARVHIRPIAPPVVLRGALGRLISKAANFLLGFVVEPLRLATFMRRERISLVHLNNSITRNHAWAMAALMARRPCITHERGINPEYSRRSLWLGRRMDAVICISAAVHDNFAARGVSGLPLTTIHNGLDPHAMRVTRIREAICRELGIEPGRRIVGILGNIKYWKGQEVVVRAMHRVHQHFPDVVCLLVGDSSVFDSEYRRQVDAAIAQLSLKDTVLITGYRVNVADYVAAMEVLIHASIEPEPFGRVLLEGMALKKPLVASRDGGVMEIVQDGVTGLLFTPGDSEDLARRLSELLNDSPRAAAMGEAGLRRLVERFGARRNAVLTQQLYARVLGSQQGIDREPAAVE